MKDGIHIVYCDRPGCGKEVGAQRIENNEVVEEEYEQGHCTVDMTDEDLHVVQTRHFCSLECCNKSEEFITPEEIEDE